MTSTPRHSHSRPASELPLQRLQTALHARYDVERIIGRGGMATVYLARDVRHDRPVALKVLNPELGAVLGSERFLAEIHVTANLQHANLLPLFDSGDADGLLFYVMPFVAGESLRARLERELQLPVDEALRIARAVGNALDHAHRQGVIHRDLKPENILLHEEQVLVADFGIALAVSRAAGERITESGLSLGTPQYMAPEQATGDRTVDARADIYSLGAVLYEMLTGEPPHAGATSQAIIARVLTETPRPVRATRSSIPQHIELAVMTALEKVPADRFSSARQFTDWLQTDVALVPPSERTRRPMASAAPHPWLRHPASLALLGVLAAIVASLALVARRPAPSEPPPVRFVLTPPRGMRVRPANGHLGAVSPDGRRIVYVGEGPKGTQLWVREIDQEQPRLLQGTDDAQAPLFSPDGQWVTYSNSASLQTLKVPISGGASLRLYPSAGPTGIEWLSPDSIVHTRGYLALGEHLYVTSATGGPSTPFLRDDFSKVSSAQGGGPYLAPDHQTLFFISRPVNGTIGDDELAFATVKERVLHRIGVKARLVLGYVAGHLIYAEAAGGIMALPFDLARQQRTGPAVSTNESTQIDNFGPKVALSRHGDLAYLGGTEVARAMIAARNGEARPLLRDERAYGHPRYSPDGRRIAFAVADGPRSDIWVYVVASGSFEKLTSEGMDNARPEWSPDSRHVLFRSNRTGQYTIWWQPADGSGQAEQLTPTLDLPVQEAVLAPDGRTLLYRVDTPGQARDIFWLTIGGDRTAQPYITTKFDEYTPRFSPDGRWVVYVSNESGRQEVYIRPFPGPGGRVLVSNDGGQEPIWSRDGKRVYYRTATALIAAAVTVNGGAVSVTGRETVLDAASYQLNRFHPMYDVAPDGEHFLMLQNSENEPRLTVVLNWTAGLARILKP